MKLADLRLANHNDAVIGTISGEIDMSNAAALQATLSEATSNKAVGLVLDLSSLDYLDSAGIELLFRLHDDLRMRSQRLLLVVPDKSTVAETFRLAGVTGRMEMAPSLRQAQAILATPAASS